MSHDDEADHVEILRTLVKQNDAMERMIVEFQSLSKRLDHLAALDDRIIVLEKRDRVAEIETVAFRTKVETHARLAWWAISIAIGGAILQLTKLVLPPL